MIIANLGTNESGKHSWGPFTLNFEITSSDSKKTEGSVTWGESLVTQPFGKAPYDVKLGCGDGGFSNSATTCGVEGDDLVGFYIVSGNGGVGPGVPGTGFYAIKLGVKD